MDISSLVSIASAKLAEGKTYSYSISIFFTIFPLHVEGKSQGVNNICIRRGCWFSKYKAKESRISTCN